MGSGEVFSINADDAEEMKKSPADEDDEWQDVEVSEEWGPQTPMTPLNDDDDDVDPDEMIHVRQPGSQLHVGFQAGSRCAHGAQGGCDLNPISYNHADYIDDQCDSFSDDCTECAQIAAAAAAAAASSSATHGRCIKLPPPPPPNCVRFHTYQ